MSDFVHDPVDSLQLRLEVDRLCDAFERCRKAGENPRIEDYLSKIADAGREMLLLELILADLEAHQDAGILPNVDEYRKRFPDCQEIIEAALAKVPPTNANGTTRLLDANDAAHRPVALDEGAAIPKRIGRYAVRRRLGRGAFGDIYLAHDADLDCLVALKVPREDRFASSKAVHSFLAEARTAHNLNHPGIVRVRDVSRESGSVIIVLDYIEGKNLAELMKSESFPPERIASLISEVADAVNYANEAGLIHRDLKPSNILVDANGRPHVSDFGLAIHEDVQRMRKGEIAGSPAYMAPEQVRGETHRLDGRTDQWSLGVILYELLTRRRPFLGDTSAEVFEEINDRDPKPPRQIDPKLPSELERICLKCLSKRMADRYPTLSDLAADLRHWQEAAAASTLPTKQADAPQASPPENAPQRIAVMPKGLRSFDEHDADFFLELLPGPRDREGLPEALRFWKTRIEETDPDHTFAVGLIYGPSGCGKTSLVRAGLLPRLGHQVRPVYVESTPEDTEVRLLAGLRKHCPALPRDLSLPEVLALVRQGCGLAAGTKVLIVLDQFEQWLHAKKGGPRSQLVDALRHCDGQRLQSIVMVRDDFWLAVSRFMRDLEVRLDEGQNSALVDLFGVEHAKKVLATFGRAFGRLPRDMAETTADQEEFLKQSVTGLAKDGKVICVRLALLAEMMKSHPWTPATLKEMGGLEGVGVTFLENTFSASTAPPEHRLHQQAARALLTALLPESGTDIKGQMRSRDELLEASGYAGRPADFDRLIGILDGEIHLVTPTDPEGAAGEDDSLAHVEDGRQYYQLTHDYLVPPLREWLTRKQKETRRGRAQVRLDERAAAWNARPEHRSLPAFWEWLLILSLTRCRDRTRRDACRKMMRAANRFHITRLVVVVILLALTAWGAYEWNGSSSARSLVNQLASARAEDVPEIVQKIGPYRRWADPLLDALQRSYPESTAEHLHAAMARLPSDSHQEGFLVASLLTAEPGSLFAIRATLAAYGDKAAIRDRLWSELGDEGKNADRRLRAGIALVTFDPPQREASERWQKSRGFLAEQLVADVTTSPLHFSPWVESLRPVGRLLDPGLERIFADVGRHESDRETTASILRDYAASDPQTLVTLLLEATPRQHAILLPVLRPHDQIGREILQSVLNTEIPTDADAVARTTLTRRRACAAVLLAELGDAGPLWKSLAAASNPDLRSYAEDRLSRLGRDGQLLCEKLITKPDTALCAALVRSLGGMPRGRLSRELGDRAVTTLADLYRDDPDPGVHSAAEWALRKWGQQDLVRATSEKLTGRSVAEGDRWFVTKTGHTMIVFGPAVSQMGSPPEEHDRDPDEAARKPYEAPVSVRIDRRFAIASKEVTMEQFLKSPVYYEHKYNVRAPEDACPINAVTWVEAAEYCKWLCETEGIPEDQWCFPKDTKIALGMALPHDFLQRTGYRLPMEDEWEYACRAATRTRFSFGDAEGLLSNYGWYEENSRGRTWPVGSLKPNCFGLFDMHGNVGEWCHDIYFREILREPIDPEFLLHPLREPMNNRAYQNVERGGSYNSRSHELRSANRRGTHPTDALNYNVGFRVVRTIRDGGE